MAQFFAQHERPRLFIKCGVKLQTLFALGALRAGQRLLHLLAQRGLLGMTFRRQASAVVSQ